VAGCRCRARRRPRGGRGTFGSRLVACVAGTDLLSEVFSLSTRLIAFKLVPVNESSCFL
jgi:hypothetical protein